MSDPTDEARMAAKWLGIWSEDAICNGHYIGGICCLCERPEPTACDYDRCQRLRHPPDFDDPVVYDRALRELTARKLAWALGNSVDQKSGEWSYWCGIDTNRTLQEYTGPTIGAAIAAAIAELSRAEQGKEVSA